MGRLDVLMSKPENVDNVARTAQNFYSALGRVGIFNSGNGPVFQTRSRQWALQMWISDHTIANRTAE